VLATPGNATMNGEIEVAGGASADIDEVAAQPIEAHDVLQSCATFIQNFQSYEEQVCTTN
jgi:hypothetical protein